MSFSMSAPSFLSLPDRVRGTPIVLEIFALKAEIPINLLQENPPLFIFNLSYGFNLISRAFANA